MISESLQGETSIDSRMTYVYKYFGNVQSVLNRLHHNSQHGNLTEIQNGDVKTSGSNLCICASPRIM